MKDYSKKYIGIRDWPPRRVQNKGGDNISDDKIYEMRKKYERANVTSVDALNKDVGQLLKEKDLSPKELDIIGGIYNFIGETLERKAVENYTRKEWQELERQYVYRAAFTLPDLVDNLLRRYEKGRMTKEQLRQERRRYRPCAHRFCLNYFIPARPKQKYCCDDCRKREYLAIREFNRTSKIYRAGTYLPPTAYKSPREHEMERQYKNHERLFEDEKLIDLMADREQKGGRRDRETEERRLRKWRIDTETADYEKVTGIVKKSTLSMKGQRDGVPWEVGK